MSKPRRKVPVYETAPPLIIRTVEMPDGTMVLALFDTEGRVLPAQVETAYEAGAKGGAGVFHVTFQVHPDVGVMLAPSTPGDVEADTGKANGGAEGAADEAAEKAARDDAEAQRKLTERMLSWGSLNSTVPEQ